MKAYMDIGGTAPLILNFGTRWRQLVSLTPRPLYPWYTLNRTLNGSKKRSGRFGENVFPPLGFEARTGLRYLESRTPELCWHSLLPHYNGKYFISQGSFYRLNSCCLETQLVCLPQIPHIWLRLFSFLSSTGHRSGLQVFSYRLTTSYVPQPMDTSRSPVKFIADPSRQPLTTCSSECLKAHS
jgi:hypothetical protein